MTSMKAKGRPNKVGPGMNTTLHAPCARSHILDEVSPLANEGCVPHLRSLHLRSLRRAEGDTDMAAVKWRIRLQSESQARCRQLSASCGSVAQTRRGRRQTFLQKSCRAPCQRARIRAARHTK